MIGNRYGDDITLFLLISMAGHILDCLALTLCILVKTYHVGTFTSFWRSQTISFPFRKWLNCLSHKSDCQIYVYMNIWALSSLSKPSSSVIYEACLDSWFLFILISAAHPFGFRLFHNFLFHCFFFWRLPLSSGLSFSYLFLSKRPLLFWTVLKTSPVWAAFFPFACYRAWNWGQDSRLFGPPWSCSIALKLIELMTKTMSV